MGTKQVGTWGSSTLLGYSTMPYSKNYYRIVEANKRAKALGISYGKYMAGLWEENERIPIIQNDFGKYERKAQQKKQPRVLEGVEAAEYVTALKVKAGTYEEPKAETKYKGNGWEVEKAKYLNEKWYDAVRELRMHPEKIRDMKFKQKEMDYMRRKRKKRGDADE